MQYYTRNEVAKLLKVHPRTVERWLVANMLRGHKLGKGKTSLWRVSGRELKRFLDMNK